MIHLTLPVAQGIALKSCRHFRSPLVNRSGGSILLSSPLIRTACLTFTKNISLINFKSAEEEKSAVLIFSHVRIHIKLLNYKRNFNWVWFCNCAVCCFFAFQPIGGPTTMNINISGLPPNTIHGFHIHEFGDIASKGELTPSMLNTNGPMPKFS